jgi:hypothetical protein
MIESLAVRLMAGQTPHGSWSYTCPTPGPDEERRLTTLVRRRADNGPDKGAPKPEPGKRTADDLPQEIRGQLEQIQRQRAARRGGDVISVGDFSNTQFAVLALWVARRHGLPVDDALAQTDKLFRQSVNIDGGWPYVPTVLQGPNIPMAGTGQVSPAGMGSTPAMTCAGLLGIGFAYGAWNENALRTDRKEKDPDKPGPAPVKPQDPSKDKVVLNAFRLLGLWVDAMAHGQAKAPRVTNANGKFYYFLWSLERVSVAYGVDKIGKTDWYDWGAKILLANQDHNGGWDNGEFRDGPDTCFALLVLKRANLAKDLTRALTSQMKGGLSTLHSGGASGADLVKGRKPFFDGPAPEEPKDRTVTGDDEAARLGAQLGSASGEKQDKLLEKLREGKGAAYTQALASAIPKLEGEALKKAREALADRLSRMTSATLGAKLEDDDPEVRRAAALAVAMKEDKAHVHKVIDMLNDREATVARAAHAALKSLSNEDFGPAKEATREERAKAVLDWKKWWDQQLGQKK